MDMEQFKMVIELAQSVTDGAFWVILLYVGMLVLDILVSYALGFVVVAAIYLTLKRCLAGKAFIQAVMEGVGMDSMYGWDEPTKRQQALKWVIKNAEYCKRGK